MEDINKRKKILKYRDIIMRMPNNKSKVLTIHSYIGLLYYYKELRELDEKYLLNYDIDDEFLDKYNNYLTKEVLKKIKEVAKLSPYLYKKFDALINEYKKNYFFSYEYDSDNCINKEQMYLLVRDFISFLGDDVSKLYSQIITNNNAIKVFDEELGSDGASINLYPIDYPCIIVQNFDKYLSYYFTIVHELGHCYQFYLLRNHQHIETFDPLCEVTSILFEKLFSIYISTENNLKKELFNNEISNHVFFLNDLSAAKVLCELFMNGDIKNIKPGDLSYKCSIPKEELERRMKMDCGCILSNKQDFDLTAFHYSIGDIIANNFSNIIKNDFDSGWKKYKDFICNAYNYPLKDVLDEYMDIDLYKKDINTFVKSYHSR